MERIRGLEEYVKNKEYREALRIAKREDGKLRIAGTGRV